MSDTNKRRLTISLDPGTYAKLPRVNKSLFVEDLLKQHFLLESGDKLYGYIKQRLQKEGLIANQNTPQRTSAYDEELERYRSAYGEDGFQFRRYSNQIQANKPPSREWVDASLINY